MFYSATALKVSDFLQFCLQSDSHKVPLLQRCFFMHDSTSVAKKFHHASVQDFFQNVLHGFSIDLLAAERVIMPECSPCCCFFITLRSGGVAGPDRERVSPNTARL